MFRMDSTRGFIKGIVVLVIEKCLTICPRDGMDDVTIISYNIKVGVLILIMN